jgi:predicted esterase
MTREDREHEMADQVEYLDHLVQRLLAECGKPVPVNVLGFSQGVATACRWAVRGKTKFAKAVLWSGTMPPELKPDELKRAFGKTELTLVHGTSDAVTKEDVLLRNQQTMRESALKQRTIQFAGGHQLDRITLVRVMGTEF